MIICKQCGKEIPDDSLFCEFCGNKVDDADIKRVERQKVIEQNVKMLQEGQEKVQQVVDETVEAIKERRLPSKNVLLSLAVVLVLLVSCISVWIYGSKSRSIEDAVYALEESAREYTQKDNEKEIFEVFMPAKMAKTLTKEQEAYYRELADVFRNAVKIRSTENVEVSTYSEKMQNALKEELQSVLGDFFKAVKTDEMQVLTIRCVLEEGANTETVVAYKYKGAWYMMPGIFDDACNKMVNQDSETAKTIASAVQTCLADETMYDVLLPYEGMVITMNHEYQYLPQLIRDTMNEKLGNALPEIAYDRYETDGFAFRVTDGLVEVFVADANNRQEWQLYPNSQLERERYLAGEHDTELPVISYENCFMQLICEQSPLLGYWQSDSAGMYIAYSATGGTEGFTVYLQTHDHGFEILHPFGDYVIGQENGKLVYRKALEDGSVGNIFEIIPQTDGTLLLNAYFSGDGDYAYTFASGQISRDIHAKLEGEWLYTYESQPLKEDSVVTMQYHEECGTVHMVNPESGCYYADSESPVFALYDGVDVLHYVTPAKNLYVEYQMQICYGGDWYRFVNDNQVNADTYWNGGGGGMYSYYYREGSEEAKRALVEDAFEAYFQDYDISYDRCAFVDIDGDNMPELVCQVGQGQFLLKYHNGSVLKAETVWSTASLYYKEGTGEFMLVGSDGACTHTDYYEFDGEYLEYAGGAYIMTSWSSDTGCDYYVSYEMWPDQTAPVDKGSYDAFTESFGEYENTVSCDYITVYEAFQAYYGITED